MSAPSWPRRPRRPSSPPDPSRRAARRGLLASLLLLPLLAVPAPEASAQAVPAITIARNASSVTEGAAAGYTLTAAPAPTSNLDVYVNLSGAGYSSYVSGGRKRLVTIPANAATHSFTIATVDDEVDESDGAMTAGIASTNLSGNLQTHYTVGSPSSAAMFIIDNDDPAVSFDSAAYDVDEGDAVTLTLNVVRPQGTATTVNVACAGSGTNPTTEFTGCPSSVTIPMNAATHTFTVQTTEDTADEVAETFTVTLSGPPAGVRIHPHAAATVTVADDDLPVITVAQDSGSYAESAREVIPSIETVGDAPVAEETEVNVELTQTGDFFDEDDLGTRTLTIRAGDSSRDIIVPLIDDDVDEADGTLTFTVLAGTGYTVHSTDVSDTVTVTDDDDPAVSFGAAAYGVAEDAGTLAIPVNIVRPRAVATTVPVACTAGTATASEYSCPASVTIAANAASADYAVTIVDDADAEGDETFTVALGAAPAGTRTVAPSSATVTVADDDAPPVTAGFASTHVAVFENAGKVRLPVVLSAAREVATPLQAITVSLSATENVDYARGPHRLTIPAGGTRATLEVPILNNAGREQHENFSVILTQPPAGIGFPSPGNQVQVTIMEISAVTISAGAGVTEGAPAAFTVTAAPAPHVDLPVNVRVRQPASGAFVDADDLGDRAVTVPAGMASGALAVPTVDDAVDEEDNSVIVSLRAGTGYTLPAEAAARTVAVLVSDDDVTPTVTVAGGAGVTEGAAATFTLTADPAPASALDVSVRVSDVAAADGDFVAAGGEGLRTVEIPASGTKAFTVDTVNDSAYEAGGDLTAAVAPDGADPAAYAVGRPSSATVAVADNDAPNVFWTRRLNGRPERSGLDASLYDALSLQATRDLGSALAVRYTLGGTAACGTDYRIDGAVCGDGGGGAGAFTLPAGTAGSSLVEFPLVEFPIAVIDDGVADSGETIAVTLVDGAEYNLGNPFTATMTIYDDTGPAAYSVAGAPRVGDVLAARRDRSDPDGDGDPGDVTHRWLRRADPSGIAEAVVGATAATLEVPAGLLGDYLSVEVTYVDGSGRSTLVETPAVGPVTEAGTPSLTVAPGPAVAAGSPAAFTVTADPAPLAGRALSVLIDVGDDPDADLLADAVEGGNGVWSFGAGVGEASCPAPAAGVPSFAGTCGAPAPAAGGGVAATCCLPTRSGGGAGEVEVEILAGNGYAVGDPSSASAAVGGAPPPPPPGGGTGGGGSGGGGGGGTAAEVRIRDAAPAVEGSPLRFRIELGSPATRRLDLLATTAPGTAADGADYLGLRSHAVTVEEGEPGTWLEVRTARDAAADESDERLAVTLSAAPGSAPVRVARPQAQGTILDGPPPEAAVPLLPAHAEARHGFVRVLDRGWRGGPASIAAVDDGGVAAADSTLGLAPGGAAHFRSSELEGGSAAKGLAPGTGAPTRGGWRLLLSGADVAAAAYARMADGFVTPLAGTLPAEADGSLFAAFFNPASNWRQRSLLRLRNPGPGPVRVAVSGTDDAGDSPGKPVSLTLAGGAARTLTAADLERGAARLDGALGDGAGKWRLSVEADGPVEAMGLLVSPAGHLANLSAATAPRAEAADGTALTLAPLFPSASDPDGRQGFLRIVNRGAEPAEVRIEARDDAGRAYPALTLAVRAGAAVHLNSHDLEQGNVRKGLPLGTGPGGGSWRLELAGPSEVVALAYLRHRDGFVTGMNALAPRVGGTHRVDFLNPGSNYRQVGALRLMNPGAEDAAALVTGVDDAGAPGGPVAVTVPAWRAVELTAAELEAGAADADGPAVEGALGDGAGKWRLRVASDRPLRVMGLLESPTGHLANLSAGAWPPAGPDGAAPDGGR